ncbi:MAG: hypothetical protein JW795_13550 [Chitinivibrionales bacterium]|nr:hypothetical protein [Chitinivibrionales bacterium]
MKNVQKSNDRLLDVWNIDAKPYACKPVHRKKIVKKVRDLKEYFDFLQRWSKTAAPTKKVSERVDKSFVL